MTMDGVERSIATRKSLTPEEGWNLVGVDAHEEPGEELYLISYHDTRVEADAAKRAWDKDHADKAWIYGKKDKTKAAS